MKLKKNEIMRFVEGQRVKISDQGKQHGIRQGRLARSQTGIIVSVYNYDNSIRVLCDNTMQPETYSASFWEVDK